MEKLSKKIKNAWTKALRSGEYKQAKGCLKRHLPEGGVGYCCLGVLAEICGAKPITEEVLDDFNECEPVKQAFIGGIDVNDISLRGYTKIPKILHGEFGAPNSLAIMNDKDNKSFVEIADWIDKNL